MKLIKLLLTLMICTQALTLQAQEQPNHFKLSTGLIITGITATCMGISYANYIRKSNEPENRKKAYCNRAEQIECLKRNINFSHTLTAREVQQQHVFIQNERTRLQQTPVIPNMNQTKSAYRLSGLGVLTAISGFGLWLYGK